MINGEAAVPSTTEPTNTYTVQPDTGYTYNIKKQSSVYMLIGQDQTPVSADDYDYIANPFPSLDPLYGFAVPLYDLEYTVQADEDTFVNKFDYVSGTSTKVRSIVISFSVFAALFLILGIVALVMHKLMGGSRSSSRDDLLQHHMDKE